MKIIQMLPELNAGGVERGVLEIAEHLVAEGHESIVVSNGGRLVEALERGGSRHIQLPVHRKNLFSLAQIPVVRRLLREEAPDILHLRSRVPAWIAWLAWRKLPPSARPRLVTTLHGFHSVNRYSKIMVRGERVIAVSQAAREYILQNFPDTPADRIVVIPRGVPQTDIRPGFQPDAEWTEQWRRDFPQLEGKAVLLLPGRVTRLKGHPDFFRLVAGLKADGLPVHGLVVGDVHQKKGGYLEELHKEILSLDLANDITFVGHRNDLREIMAVCDITLNLSQKPESFGRTTLESLAIGKPVVGYAHGGVAEQLTTVFPAGAVLPRDLNGLIEATRRVLRTGGRPAAIPPEFTREEMCRATLEVYQTLHGKNETGPQMS